MFLTTPSHQITGRIEPTVSVSVGDEISLIPNMEKAKFFNLEDEKAIR